MIPKISDGYLCRMERCYFMESLLDWSNGFLGGLSRASRQIGVALVLIVAVAAETGWAQNPTFGGDGYHLLMDNVAVPMNSPVTAASAGAAFDQLWSAFDTDYAMFVLHPEVDWNASRGVFRPLATNCTSAYDLAKVFVQMLEPLQDLHVWLTLSGNYISTYDPLSSLNANPAAYQTILGGINSPSSSVQWTVTQDQVGFIAINSWTDSQTPALCDQALEQMRNTRGLIVDVRSNGGGSETLAKQVAARFQYADFVYALYQVRNGPNHTDLSPKYSRTISPRGPWRYDRPVILLIGQCCFSSNESFVGMMAGATNITTMGDHTGGASGNPETINLPLNLTVTVSTWIDYLPNGSLLEDHGFQPQIPFTPAADSFSGTNDALLSAALARLSAVPLPAQPIPDPSISQTNTIGFDDLSHNQAVPWGYCGLTWNNFYAYNAVTGISPFYGIPMLSSPYVAYNGWGNSAVISNSVPFDLLSAEMASAFNEGMNLEVKGYSGANLIYDRNFTLSAIAPLAIQFDCYGATSVTFTSFGGTVYRWGGETQFTMDDLVIGPHNAPAPLLEHPALAGGSVTFSWAAQAGQTYQVQYTTDLSHPNWTNLGSPLTTEDNTLTSVDSCTDQQRFYRVLVLL